MEFQCKSFLYQPKGLETEQTHQFEVDKIIFNLYHKQYPNNLNQHFTKSKVRHSHPTRCSTFHVYYPIHEKYEAATIFLIPGCQNLELNSARH